jgi:hypothetical protein
MTAADANMPRPRRAMIEILTRRWILTFQSSGMGLCPDEAGKTEEVQ